MQTLPPDKSQARRVAETRRRAIQATDHVTAPLNAYLDSLDWRGALAGYVPFRSEASPLAAMRSAVMCRKPVCVPVVMARGMPLKFREWTPDSVLEAGAFGVMVPAAGAWIEPTVIICPLLAFDRFGYRLGYGGGFYDRTLAVYKDRCHVIGLAFDGQECERVPRDRFDQPLDAIATETGVRMFGRDKTEP